MEINLIYKKMIIVRNYLKKSSDKESILPIKLPNATPTRPWIGLSNFFSAFLKSFETINQVFSDKVDCPTDKLLIETYSNCFSEFNLIFKTLESAKLPTTHLVIINYLKMRIQISKWPKKVNIFKRNIEKSNFQY